MVKKTMLFFLMCLVVGEAFATGGLENRNSSSDVENWPTKPLTFLVPVSPGGSTDLMVRFMATALEKQLGQRVNVINRPGAGGWICWNELINSRPDGYTVGVATAVGFALGHYDQANPRSETIDDFDLICNHVTDMSVIGIRNDEQRFTDVASLIAYARNNTILTAASALGILSDDATLIKKLEVQQGVKVDIVQVPGAKEVETMFLSKDIDLYLGNVGDIRQQHLRKDFKILCVFGPKRSELIPDVPTWEELGYPSINNDSSRGYTFPKGVDPKIKAKMAEAIKNAVYDPLCKDKLDELGAETNFLDDKGFYNLMQDMIDDALKVYGISR